MSVDEIFDRDTASVIYSYLFAYDMFDQMSKVHEQVVKARDFYDERYSAWKELLIVDPYFMVGCKPLAENHAAHAFDLGGDIARERWINRYRIRMFNEK